MQKWEYKRAKIKISKGGFVIINKAEKWYNFFENGVSISGGKIYDEHIKSFYDDGQQITDYLNNLGKEGWEIISVYVKGYHETEIGMVEDVHLLLKRQIPA